MTGSWEIVDGRPAVRFERRLPHPVERVWRAVTQPEELAAWFPCRVRADLRPGGAMTFDFGPDLHSEGRVTDWDPPRRFAFLWGADRIVIGLEPLQDGTTLLTLTHVLSEDPTAVARTAAGWHVCLNALEHRLADPSSPPVETGPTPQWRAHHDFYAERGFPAAAEVPRQG